MQKIGIIGFGIVGKSALRFLQERTDLLLSVWDQRTILPNEKEFVLDEKFSFFSQEDISLREFIGQNDQVIISPGVDLFAYATFKKKFICELDLFSQYFLKKTIAITGTLGKTTVARLVHALLPQKSICIGNVGQPMLDGIAMQDGIDWAVLELSSFQLEYSKQFTPDIAMLTNVYSNHLDWHKTLNSYLSAKWNLFAQQGEGQYGVFPLDFTSQIKKYMASYKGIAFFVADYVPTAEQLDDPVLQNKDLFFLQGVDLYRAKIIEGSLVGEEFLCSLGEVNGFVQNWLYGVVALCLAGVDVDLLQDLLHNQLQFSTGEHRLELFKSVNGIDFYNDSKATVVQATQTAVLKLAQNGRPIILVLGGLDKGVDRSSLCSFLSKINQVKKVLFLGQAEPALSCYEQYASLDDLVHAIMHCVQPGDQVLFSPSGTSFDLFKNYKERGTLFKEKVLDAYR